jgi:dTMP kinase
MWSKNKFIVIEGVDGVGKSTVCKILQRYIQDNGGECDLLYGVPDPYFRIAMEVPYVKNVYSRYFFYHASNIATADRVRDILAYTNVVLDRYCYSTFAYHRARGAKIAPPVFTEFGLLEPNLSVLLSVDNEAIRQERIALRDQEKSIDDRERKGVGSFIDEVEASFGLLNMFSVDNSTNDPRIAALEIIQKLSE